MRSLKILASVLLAATSFSCGVDKDDWQHNYYSKDTIKRNDEIDRKRSKSLEANTRSKAHLNQITNHDTKSKELFKKNSEKELKVIKDHSNALIKPVTIQEIETDKFKEIINGTSTTKSEIHYPVNVERHDEQKEHFAANRAQIILLMDRYENFAKTNDNKPSLAKKCDSRRHNDINFNPEYKSFENSYVMPTSEEIEYVQDLLIRMKQESHVNSLIMNRDNPGRFSKETEKEIFEYVLLNPINQRISYVEEFDKIRNNIILSYKGKQTGVELYKHMRKKFKPALFDCMGFLKKFQNPPELHHYLYKSLYPELAVESKNLVILTRGKQPNSGQHELIHNVSSMGNNAYKTINPGVEFMLKYFLLE